MIYLLLLIIGTSALLHPVFGRSPDWPSVCPDIILRSKWGARVPDAVDYAMVPLKNVVVHHTATGNCTNEEECSSLLKQIQTFHMDTMEFPDIGYNFMIGGDGQVYEGSGWHKVGAHTRGYNSRSIGIAFIGNFNEIAPNGKMLLALKNFLDCAVELGELDREYRLFGARQVSATLSPGNKLYGELRNFSHFAAIP